MGLAYALRASDPQGRSISNRGGWQSEDNLRDAAQCRPSADGCILCTHIQNQRIQDQAKRSVAPWNWSLAGSIPSADA